jgi:cell division protein DivIC
LVGPGRVTFACRLERRLTEGQILDSRPGATIEGQIFEFMKFLTRIPAWLKNKYLLTTVGFVVWIMFFDARDFITSHFRERAELAKLEKSKQYYEQQITVTRHELDQLKTDPGLLEKYAREKYLMKRDNEDLFVIREGNPNKH